jgi:hypothetical protein
MGASVFVTSVTDCLNMPGGVIRRASMNDPEGLPARFATARTLAAAATGPGKFRLGPRFVDDDGAPAEFGPIEPLNGRLGILFRLHLDEREPARTPGRHVPHDAHRLDGARLLEQVLELALAGAEREVTDEQFPTHEFLSYL